MSLSLKSLRRYRKGIHVVFLPNSPNPEYLPQPIRLRILPDQYWMGKISGTIKRISSVTLKKVSLFTKYDKPDSVYRKRERIDIIPFLNNYHLIQEASFKKSNKTIKLPDKLDKLNIL